MKILLLSLLKREVTSKTTASRPQIIYQLARGLVKKGHEVTVLGTGDTQIEGTTVIPIIPQAFVHMKGLENPFYVETAYLVRLAKKLEEIGNNYDIIHNHTYPEFINLLVAELIKTPMATTIHAQATEEIDTTLSLFQNTQFVALSEAHRNMFAKTHPGHVVYNGVDTDFFIPQEDMNRSYFLFVGRMSKAKGADGRFLDPKGVTHAIALARKAGIHLKIVGNVEDKAFYDKLIAPFLSRTIEFVGDVSVEQKLTRQEIRDLYRGAKALLMTINWEEPFGLVMAEAMSCGTPVIGFNRGSVGEIIVDGLTGFVVDQTLGVEGLVQSLKKLDSLSPEQYREMSGNCRRRVEEHFSVEKMVENYESLYKEIAKQRGGEDDD